MLPWLIGGLVAAFALKRKIAPSSPSALAGPSDTIVVPLGSGSPVPASQPKSQNYFQRDAQGRLLAVWGWNGTAWVNLTAGVNLNAPTTTMNFEVIEARRLLPVTPAFGFGAPTLYNPSAGMAVSAPSPASGGYSGGGLFGTGTGGTGGGKPLL